MSPAACKTKKQDTQRKVSFTCKFCKKSTEAAITRAPLQKRIKQDAVNPSTADEVPALDQLQQFCYVECPECGVSQEVFDKVLKDFNKQGKQE